MNVILVFSWQDSKVVLRLCAGVLFLMILLFDYSTSHSFIFCQLDKHNVMHLKIRLKVFTNKVPNNAMLLH